MFVGLTECTVTILKNSLRFYVLRKNILTLLIYDSKIYIKCMFLQAPCDSYTSL